MFDLNEPLLTEVKAAQLLGITVNQLAIWRAEDKGPEWLCIGRRIIRYEPAAITRWLNSLGHRTEQDPESWRIDRPRAN